MTTPVSAEEHQAAIDAEYGVYVATEDIFLGGARAFNTGDPVPASHVSRGVVTKEQVAKRDTKAGQAATESNQSPSG